MYRRSIEKRTRKEKQSQKRKKTEENDTKKNEERRENKDSEGLRVSLERRNQLRRRINKNVPPAS